MRRVYKARIVPDHAPDGMTEKVVKVNDLGVPIAVALGSYEALTDEQLAELRDELSDIAKRRRTGHVS